MNESLTLISHALCPFVQRAAIVLAEKQVPFARTDIDLANKPDWFRAISPLGKTPVLLVCDQPIFESAVICEYLDETRGARLHPKDPLERARHRGWMEFGSAVLSDIGGFYTASDKAALEAKRQDLANRFVTLEAEMGDGPYFGGLQFSLVDAVFGPVFRYFDVFDQIADFCVFAGTPKVRAWRAALAQRKSVRDAAHDNYAGLLRDFLLNRRSELSRLMAESAPK